MKRIAIVGIMGAGKSTFADKLGKMLNREVIHLDKEFWLPGWRAKYTEQEWADYQRQLVQGEEWIIDGNYRRTIDIRLQAADTIFYFDISKIKALYRVIKRSFIKHQPFDKAEGIKERVTWEIIKFILNYSLKDARQKIMKYKGTKNVIVFKNDDDAERFLKGLK